MNWFRSNVRLGSRLALFALAIQFLLSFGHFHGSAQTAASPRLHASIDDAAAHLDASDIALRANVSSLAGLGTSPDHEPAGQPADDCAICAVMALAFAMLDASPPSLPAPQAAALLYLTADAGFADLRSPRVAFQPRAPPAA